jgi:hypothetical protein
MEMTKSGSHSHLPGGTHMSHLVLWRERKETGLAPARVHERLESGDDVEGLDDLPIREMIDKIRHEFPGSQEGAGVLQWNSGEESFRATWTWQYLRFDAQQLSEEHREKLFELARQFHCPVFDASMNLRMV